MDRSQEKARSNRLVIFYATWAYSGYAPVAPGTAGTLATIPLVIFFSFLTRPVYLFCVLLMFFLGVAASSYCIRQFQDKDPSKVVIDETVGFLITMFLVPLSPASILTGFFLFRVADIIKPFPARDAEKLPAGWGVMMDDVVAGLYANIVLQVIWRFIIH